MTRAEQLGDERAGRLADLLAAWHQCRASFEGFDALVREILPAGAAPEHQVAGTPHEAEGHIGDALQERRAVLGRLIDRSCLSLTEREWIIVHLRFRRGLAVAEIVNYAMTSGDIPLPPGTFCGDDLPLPPGTFHLMPIADDELRDPPLLQVA